MFVMTMIELERKCTHTHTQTSIYLSISSDCGASLFYLYSSSYSFSFISFFIAYFSLLAIPTTRGEKKPDNNKAEEFKCIYLKSTRVNTFFFFSFFSHPLKVCV